MHYAFAHRSHHVTDPASGPRLRRRLMQLCMRKNTPATKRQNTSSARPLASHATKRPTTAGGRPGWPTSSAIRSFIRTRCSATSPTLTRSAPSLSTRSPSSMAAAGSSATSRSADATISRFRRSGTSSNANGSPTTSPMAPIGGRRFYGKANTDRPTGPTCDGCHSVNYNLATRRSPNGT